MITHFDSADAIGVGARDHVVLDDVHRVGLTVLYRLRDDLGATG